MKRPLDPFGTTPTAQILNPIGLAIGLYLRAVSITLARTRSVLISIPALADLPVAVLDVAPTGATYTNIQTGGLAAVDGDVVGIAPGTYTSFSVPSLAMEGTSIEAVASGAAGDTIILLAAPNALRRPLRQPVDSHADGPRSRRADRAWPTKVVTGLGSGL